MILFPLRAFGEEIKLPFSLSVLKAGFPSPADDFLDREIDLNEHLVRNRDATVLAKVEGDSMETTLSDGDILVVDKSLLPHHNDVIVAVIEGEFTVKRFLKVGNMVTLSPDNESYEPIKVEESMGFWCWGVVTYAIRKP